MNRQNKLLAAAAALVLLCNAVVLTGAWSNRSGEPQAQLTLTQRELNFPYRWDREENSGLSLKLSVRTVPAGQANNETALYVREPEWLDQARMRELGFPDPKISSDSREVDGHEHEPICPDISEREVFVVLEQDGAAYRRMLHFAELAAQKEHDKQQDQADAPKCATYRENRCGHDAEEWLTAEQQSNSRLFAIDAGLDAVALRERYADRKQYAVVHGRVGRNRYGKCEEFFRGVSNDDIHVPTELAAPLAERGANNETPAFTAVLAYGQRLEPWLVKVDTAVAAATQQP